MGMERSPRGDRLREEEQKAIEDTTVRAGSWTSAQAHLERSLRDSVIPQSHPSAPAGRTRRKAKHRRNRSCPARGSNRRELPSPY